LVPARDDRAGGSPFLQRSWCESVRRSGTSRTSHVRWRTARITKESRAGMQLSG
jgi:hypothetical protein